MAIRALGPDGGSNADIADAFDYAAENGARVVNASLGGPGSSTTLTNAVKRHPTVLFVVAAGNAGTNNDAGLGTSPCNITEPNLICVAATDPSDGLASFSNFGTTSVDLAAPGTNILSTVPSRSRVIMSDGFEADDFATRWDAHGNVPTKWTRTTMSAAAGSASMTDSAGAGSTTAAACSRTRTCERG